MNCVYLDTMILVWGIKKSCTAGQEEMIERAETFLRRLREDATEVAVPAVVLGELYIRLSPLMEAEVFADLTERKLIVHPYDAWAAICAARVWREKKQQGVVDELIANGDTSKTTIKADCQIIGTAISRKGLRIYSHDGDIKALASGFIEVVEMPPLPPRQGSIFN